MKKPKLLGVRKLKIAGIFMLALFTQSGCQVCECNTGMNNTGIGCGPIFRDSRNLWLQPTYGDDGTRNGIPVDGSVTLNQTYFETLASASTSKDKRIYPISSTEGLKNVEEMPAEDVFRTFTDGSKEHIRKGTQPFVGWITGKEAQPKYAGKLEAVRCQYMSVWKIDRGGNLVGEISADGKTLYPIQIDSGSFYATFMPATADQNNAYIHIGFDFSQNFKSANLAMISCSEISSYSLFSLRGLIDVCPEFSDIETTGMNVKLVTEWGTPLNPTLDQGLVAADFEIENATQSSAIGFTGTGGDFEETSPGNYAITFDTADQPDPGDELKVTITKTGRDYACVTATEVVVPNS